MTSFTHEIVIKQNINVIEWFQQKTKNKTIWGISMKPNSITMEKEGKPKQTKTNRKQLRKWRNGNKATSIHFSQKLSIELN